MAKRNPPDRRLSMGRNRPPLNTTNESWLAIIERVHREDLPKVRERFAARRNPNKARLGPRPKRKRS